MAELINLGPKSAAMLAAAGVDSVAKLRKLGAVRAYMKVKRAYETASLNLPSLNLLWALEGALTNTHWRVVARERRTALLFELDDLSKGAISSPPKSAKRR
jgi:DNA transformation protein and related proteins